MLVKTYKDGLSRTGLHIGEANAQRYFSRRRPFIELRLDDLHIQCTLSPEFWQGRPEIHDPRLSEWLQFKMARQRQGREPIQLTLVPSGSDTFVLRPRPESRYDAFGADVNLPHKAKAESDLRPAFAQPLATRSVA
jgi:hypothetical protein